MRQLSPGLQEALASGTTTLCWCWLVTPRVGGPLGFTDHDRDIVLDGVVFEAASGLASSEIRASVGLSVDDLEVESALVSSRLSEERLAAGDFDDAKVEIFRVDWSSPEGRVLMRTGTLGEVRRTGNAFTAEVRGLAHYLQQSRGRVFQQSCDAALGDARCGVDLDGASRRATATVVATVGARTLGVAGLSGFADGWFAHGNARFETGANAGRAFEVKRHALTAAAVVLELWQLPAAPIAAGDVLLVTAGCDKLFATCREKFANGANFRGFPHMPGNDYLASPRIGS